MASNEKNNSKTLTVRLDEDTYSKMMEVLDDIGLDFSSAVRVFARQMIREQGLPFKPGRTREADSPQ